MNTLVVFLIAFLLCQDSPHEVEYTLTEQGPRTIYEGTVRLNFSGETTDPCLNRFAIPIEEDSRLAGPIISSDPGQPILNYDIVTVESKTLYLTWCKFNSKILHYPHSIPRYFKFYTIKTKFNGEDLEKLLADWGVEDSPWDLNLDGTVGGEDIAILLNGWQTS